MGFILVSMGFLITVNPMIHVIDIFPDVFGFLLIALGLRKTSFFVSKIAEARSFVWKLVFIESIKLFSIVLIPYGSVVSHQIGSMQVLLTFVFGLMELIYFIPAVNSLFEGISFIGLAYNATLIYKPKTRKYIALEVYEKENNGKKKKCLRFVKRERKTEIITSAKKSLISFFVFRNVMTLIPELTELEIYEFIGNVSANSRPLTYYKPLLYILSIFSVLIFGIICYTKARKCFCGIKKDRVLIDGLKAKYENDIEPKKTMFISLDMKASIILFSIAVVTSFTLFIDGVNIVVGCISSGFLIAAAAILGKYAKLAKISIPFSVVRAVLSIVNMIGESNYFSEYVARDADHFERAEALFYPLARLELIEDNFALVAMVLFIIALLMAVKSHLAICGIQFENAQYSKTARDAEVYNHIRQRFIIAIILTAVNFAMSQAYLYLLVFYDLIVLINSVITIIWALYTVSSVNLANTYLYNKEIENS